MHAVVNRWRSKFRRELSKVLSRQLISKLKLTHKNQTIKIPVIQGVGASNFMLFDRRMSSFVEVGLSNKGGNVLDIGANVGVFLIDLLASKRYFSYTGVEPNPLCVHYVHELIRINQIPDSKIFALALSDESQSIHFHSARVADKMASVHPDARSDGKRKEDHSFDALSLRGDNFLRLINHQPIDLIKIDVEGAEVDVLSGLKGSIQAYRPWVFCEVWKLPDPTDRLFQRIQSARAALWTLLDDLEYVALDDNLQLISADSSRGGDLILVHRDELSRFLDAWEQHG